MGQNIYQVYQGNPITTNEADDLMYFGRSPYSATDDAAMTFQNFAAQFLTPTTGVVSITGTQYQVLANGTYGSAVTGGNVTLTLPQDIATTSSPTFAGLTAANINIATNTISSINTNGNIDLVPDGTGVVSIGSSSIPPIPGGGTGNALVMVTGVSKAVGEVSTRYSNDIFGPGLIGQKSRATTIGSYSAVTNDDLLLTVSAFGDDGSAFTQAANIVFMVSGSISSGIVPGKIQFGTANSSGVLTTAATIDSSQNLNLTNPLTVANGGTGKSSLTAYTLLAGGTTTTGALQQVSAGSAGQLLQSNGASGLPTWTTATFPSGSGTLNHMLRSDGTNWVQTTSMTVDASDNLAGLTSVSVGNLQLTGNTLSSTNTNGNVIVSPNGNGILNSVSSIQITSPTSPAVKYIGLTAATDSRLIMQAGTITSSDGGALNLYGATHATRAGWVVAGLSTAGAFFAVNDSALAGGTNQFTVARADGSVVSNGSITASSNIISNAGYVQSGLSSGGFAGNVILYPSTASKGSLSLLAADSGANYANILTNASTSAARTWTLPDASGTIALTSGASGIVNSGTQNQLAWYAANGTTVSGLSTANNGLLVTNGSGVPSIGNAIGADITVNGIFIGTGGQTQSNYVLANYSVPGGYGTGRNNSALGYAAMVGGTQTTAQYNVAIGSSALSPATSASYNASVGAISLASATSASYNTAIGALSGRASGVSIGTNITTGTYNTLVGYASATDSASATGVLAIGAQAVADSATGSTSGTNGPSIAIGSTAYPVGFRGDASIYPSAGTSAGYWRVKINGTFYKILLCADS